MPKVNPRQMQQMMQKMGISQNEIPATQVIIRCEDKDLIVENPTVLIIDMMGQKMFQISGAISEQRREVELSKEDIETVMDQTGVDRAVAINAITEAHYDLAKAILNLKKIFSP